MARMCDSHCILARNPARFRCLGTSGRHVAPFESAETVLREAAAADSVDNLVQLSKLQSNAILDQLRQEKLSAEEAAELSVVTQRLCLREPYKRMVLAALEKSTKGPLPRPKSGARLHQGHRLLR